MRSILRNGWFRASSAVIRFEGSIWVHFSRKSAKRDKSWASVFSIPNVSRSLLKIGRVGTIGMGTVLTVNYPWSRVCICCDILKSSSKNWFDPRSKCFSANLPLRRSLPEILPFASMCSLSRWLLERPGNINLPVKSSKRVQPALQTSTAES